MSVVMQVRPEDIRRIRISCGCGEQSIAEIPYQLAGATHIHCCPKCPLLYMITNRAGTWKYKRVPEEMMSRMIAMKQEDIAKAFDDEEKPEKDPVVN